MNCVGFDYFRQHLFNEKISDWGSWGRVFQSIEAFEPIIKRIFAKHSLPYKKTENCTPGTNAVFKVTVNKCDSLIVKIFAPKESGMDTESDFNTELFGLRHADRAGVSAPRLIASGEIEDRYTFKYMVMEYIEGKALGQLEASLSEDEKYKIGCRLRELTEKLNVPCEKFNNIDIVSRGIKNSRWNCFPTAFLEERADFIKNYNTDDGVFVHGDLNPDNVLVGVNNNLFIIDFADALTAPAEYELAALICELFWFEKSYLKGYFDSFDIDDLTEKCCRAVLVHDFGSGIIKCNFGRPEEINSISGLKERIHTAITLGHGLVD